MAFTRASSFDNSVKPGTSDESGTTVEWSSDCENLSNNLGFSGMGAIVVCLSISNCELLSNDLGFSGRGSESFSDSNGFISSNVNFFGLDFDIS